MLEGEQVFGVLGGRIKVGFFKSASMAMIVTNRRLVLAEITKDMLAREVEKIQQRSAKEKPGLFDRMAMALNANKELLANLGERDPDEVSAESAKNFVIPLEKVVQGRVSSTDEFDSDRQYQRTNVVVQIKTTDKEYKLTLDASTAKPQDILQQALGTRFVKGFFK